LASGAARAAAAPASVRILPLSTSTRGPSTRTDLKEKNRHYRRLANAPPTPSKVAQEVLTGCSA
jgi:hypothetical protein